MPKNPFRATRRKSSGNVLDFQPENLEPAQSSFKVLERPKQGLVDGGNAATTSRTTGRPFTSQLNPLRGKSADDLGLHGDRGSGDTTNSGSSGHYDSSAGSARYSSTSTLPSSVDQERDAEDDLYPVSRPAKSATFGMSQAVTLEDELPPVPSFATRTGRAFSFGLKNRLNSSQSNKGFGIFASNGSSRNEDRQIPHRGRAETASSYASTAVPNRPAADTSLGSSALDFGESFGDMFSSNSSSQERLPPPPPPPPHGFHRTESEPLYPPRTHSRQAFVPSPSLESTRQNAGSPYLDDEYTQEREGFLPSSNLSSPKLTSSSHATVFGQPSGYAPLSAGLNSPTLERMSSDSYASSIDENSKTQEAEKTKPTTNRPQGDADEDRFLKRHQLVDSPVGKLSTSATNPSSQPPQSGSTSTLRANQFDGRMISRSDTVSSGKSDSGSLFTESTDATPRQRGTGPTYSASADRENPSNVHSSSLSTRPPIPEANRLRVDGSTNTGPSKRMTKAQFEALQNENGDKSDEDQESDNELSDDDDVERAKKITNQRRRQEANMSVYRQQMKKTAGGGPTDLPVNGRPELNRSSNSAPAAAFGGFHLGGIDGKPPGEVIKGKHDGDDDDDVPLGILQAHGFPNGNRPPTASDGQGIHRSSTAGSIVGGGAGQGSLPPFARRLPQDPYFGASIVNPAVRESLQFNSDAASVYGMPPSAPPHMAAQLAPPQMGHPGGLVGVIAGEERARAARRGSPNAQGGYGSVAMPLPSNMPAQIGRTMSMGNIPPPSAYTPSGAPPMPPMPMMSPMAGFPGQAPADQTQQQMQQFMQMQMQFMQNMLAIQQGQMGQTPQPQPDLLGVPGQSQSRPTSMASQVGMPQFGDSGRSMTMMNAPPSWGNVQTPMRPQSSLPVSGGYFAASGNGLAATNGGLGPGYAPSIAPSERSNIGMPSRYRPVSNMGDGQSVRAQSLTSSLTLQALKDGLQSTPDLLRPDFQFQQQQQQQMQQQMQQHMQVPNQAKSTIRIVDKPKGTPKVSTLQLEQDEDEDEGWAAMKKKREERKFRLGRKKTESDEPSFGELYKGLD